MDKSLINQCLYNWLGYGNPNAMTWFVGTEEAGAEFHGNNKTLEHEESMLIRSEFNLAMDFRYVWEELYKLPLEGFKGKRVWHYMAVFLLNSDNSHEIKNYIFNYKKLGRTNSNHFLCELLPLPKPSKGRIEPYKHFWRSITDYHDEVLPKRIDLILNTLSSNQKVKLIVCYESLFVGEVVKRYNIMILEECNNEHYCLYLWQFSKGRTIFLLSTPFFGQSRSKKLTLSYKGLKETAIHTKRTIQNK
ncbi:hypothetical protein [Mesobacillus jeotgali]|uniref:Uncharacterized protein n=1 Tax=Mesobacillus jeotgali TaxID=129985 RepID=A0ABY9VBX9_9BACI|nr:hypothetical protein [Mesobacillus jeotgali]WNF21320.1 hypothetical protein RH061_14060 [Mesobacillus jeotgali]